MSSHKVSSSPSLQDMLLTGAASLWLLLLVSEYASTYFDIAKFSSTFSYWGLSIGLIALASALAYFMPRLSVDRLRPNGIMIYGLFVLVSLLIFRTALSANNIELSNFGIFAKHYFVTVPLVVLIVASAHNWGQVVLRSLSARLKSGIPWPLNIATGIMLISLYLFMVSAVGFLNIFSVLPVFLSLILFYKSSIDFFKSLLIKPLSKDWNSLGWISGSVIFLFIAINFLNLMRPIPTGFDALSLYLNLSNLIADQNMLVSGNQPYNWSVFMSIGYLFSNNSSLALSLALLGGVLSVSATYHLSKLWLDSNTSMLCAALVYTLPSVVFQSYKDMKTDLGLLFILLASTIAFVLWLRQSYIKRKEKDKVNLWQGHKLLWVAGALLGFGLGIKFTTYFLIVAVVTGLAYRFGKLIGGLGMFAFVLGITLVMHFDEMSGLRQYQSGVEIIQWLLVAVGIAGLSYSWVQNKKQTARLIPAVLSIALASVIIFSPWLFKNAKESKPIEAQKLLFGERVFPDFDVTKSMSVLPPQQGNQSTSGQAGGQGQQQGIGKPEGWEATGVQEEVQRYIGYERGLLKYLSIPYDISFGTHVNGIQNNVGYIILFLLPLLLLVWYKKAVFWNILVWVSAFLLFGMYRITAASQLSQLDPSQVGSDALSKPSGGFLSGIFGSIAAAVHTPFSALAAVTPALVYPALMLLFLGGFILLDKRLTNSQPRPLRVLIMIAYCYACLWMLLSGGIVWYGLWFFAILFMIMGIWLNEIRAKTQYFKYAAAAGIGLWLLLATFMRVGSYDNDPSFQQFSPVVPSFQKYMSGEIPDDGQIFKHMSPAVQDALNIINQDPSARIYRVGTNYNFFIKNNHKRVREDNQLDLFNNIYTHHNRNIEPIHDAFKANGYRYVLVDLNTANIDITEKKTLEQKFNSLMSFLQQNPRMRMIATDRVVADADGNRQYALSGQQLLYGGTFALYAVD